jgi:alkylation response protein AidB-like acyl-CoA dehydrogenase
LPTTCPNNLFREISLKLALDESDVAFQSEVRAYINANLNKHVSEKVRLGYGAAKAEVDEWTRMLNQKGWAAPHWPVEVGGANWSAVRRHVFDNELRAAHAPELQGFGFSMVGPAIIKYGSPAQKAEYLPKILNAEMSWCQGYSEQQAGSDLASLRTTAISRGDNYVVNGSKIWTSAAEVADHIFVLVKTDTQVKPQRGISFLLIDMATPGITVKPLLAFNGVRLWNQVFFDNVVVPKPNRLGEEGKGWTVAKNLLGNERLQVSRVAENRRLLNNLLDISRAEQQRGADLDPSFWQKLASLEIRLEALDATALRLLSKFDGGGGIGPEVSMLKLKGSQLIQAMDTLIFEAIGLYGLPLDSIMRDDGTGPIGTDYADMVASRMCHHRGYTIAGGASEVQHNIIAQAVLGL